MKFVVFCVCVAVVVVLAHGAPADRDVCPRSQVRIVNGLQTRINPSVLMLASSERDRRHSATHGLVYGRTGWSPKWNRNGEWLEADLGSWVYVRQVRVYLLTPGVEVKVEAGVDPAEWTEASWVEGRSRVRTAIFDPPVLSRYARVTVTDLWEDIELEMMVIGCEVQRAVAKENLLY